MGSSKPKPVQAPFKSDETRTNTYAPFSIAGTPEGQSFLNTPLDFGDPIDVDPGAGNTALEEQEADLRANSAFNSGTPRFFRQANLEKEKRDIRGRGVVEAREARLINQQGNNAMRAMRTQTELGRRQALLPQILQTGGTGSTSGFNTQVVQPQPGFWQRLALGVAQGAASGLKIPGLGG